MDAFFLPEVLWWQFVPHPPRALAGTTSYMCGGCSSFVFTLACFWFSSLFSFRLRVSFSSHIKRREVCFSSCFVFIVCKEEGGCFSSVFFVVAFFEHTEVFFRV